MGVSLAHMPVQFPLRLRVAPASSGAPLTVSGGLETGRDSILNHEETSNCDSLICKQISGTKANPKEM